MSKRIVSSDKVPPSRSPLSQATVFGNLVFLSGRVGRHPQTGQLGRDIREQTKFALEAIQAILKAAGTSLENVLQVTSFLVRSEDLEAYNEVYRQYIPNQWPARTTVVVPSVHPGVLVEITAIAGIPGP